MPKREKRRTYANGQASKSLRKDGCWDVEIPIWTPEGRRRHRSAIPDENAADRWLNKTRYERDEGSLLTFEAATPTVEPYFNRWLKDCAEGTISRYTCRDYPDKVTLHLVPALGRLKLKTLTATHLQVHYRAKLDTGLSTRTIRYIHTTISKALSQAEAWDLVRKNVAKFAKPPSLVVPLRWSERPSAFWSLSLVSEPRPPSCGRWPCPRLLRPSLFESSARPMS
jgi:integrase